MSHGRSELVFSGPDNIGDAWFSPQCPKCGQFLNTDKAVVTCNEHKGLCGAEGFVCARCGEVKPDFLGFM